MLLNKPFTVWTNGGIGVNIIFLLTGLLMVFILAFVVSNNRKQIRYKPILYMLIAQFVIAFVLLHSKIGVIFISLVAKTFERLMDMGMEGVNFVFSGIENKGESTFFLHVLLPIVFISVLIGILNYLKILPFIIKYTGLGLSKLNGMGKLENYLAVSSAVLGQSEVFLTTKEQLGMVSSKRLYTLCTSAMSAVSMSIIGSYMTMLPAKYVVVAIFLNILSALIIANIINPYELKKEEDFVAGTPNREGKAGFFDVVSESIMDGFKVAVIVAAMLIGFIALMALINAIFSAIFHITFQTLLGYVFAPVAFLMGVPWHDAVQAGSIMATKLITNEFVAMINLKAIAGGLSAKTMGILSVFLISFANFGSIGIIIGSVKALNEKRADEVARFGMKLLYGSTLASILSATIAGCFL
jgi:nucleoside transport protein